MRVGTGAHNSHSPHPTPVCVGVCVCVWVGVKQSITISYQGKYIIVDRALSEVIASRKLLAKFLKIHKAIIIYC